MKLSFSHAFNIGIVLVMTAVVVMAMGYNRSSALLPLLVSVPVLIFSLAQTIIDFRKNRGPAAVVERNVSVQDAKDTKKKFAKEIEVSLWVLAMFISLYLFGFVATTFFYILLSLKVRSGFGWKVSLGVSSGCFAFLYFLLIGILKVDLYEGVITVALKKIFLGY